MLDIFLEIFEDPLEYFAVFAFIVFLSGIFIYTSRSELWSLPIRSATGHLVKETVFTGDPNDEYEEFRHSYSVGVYEYVIDGRKHRMKVRSNDDSPLDSEAEIYYKRGASDASVSPEFGSSVRGMYKYVLWFALCCPVIACIVFHFARMIWR